MRRIALAGRTHNLAFWTLAYLVLAAAVFAVLFESIGVVPALQVSVSLILAGTLPGAALVRRLFPHPSILHYVVVGTVIGLGLWSLGGMFSHITGLFWVRWIPIVAGFTLWLIPHRRLDDGEVANTRGFPILGAIGSGLGLVALLPSIRNVLLSQPTQWAGWHRFYVDLPFHIAMTSEVAARSPQVYPWVADTPLSYTWLYHSSMGVWASITNVSAADVVLQAWPILFAVLIPALISITAWEVTRNKYVALAAPLVYVLPHGLIFATRLVGQIPLFQISPTRDFAHLFILLCVLSLVRLLGNSSLRATNGWWFLILGISTFVLTGAKGSAMPIVLGGVLCSVLFLIIVRRLRVIHLLVAGEFVVVAVASFFLTLPEPGSTQSLAWGPLAFSGTTTPLAAVVILAILIFATLGAWLVIGIRAPNGWLVSNLLGGVVLAGLLGLGLLTHPSGSELYFWQSAQPLFAIILTWAGTILIGTYGKKFALAVFSIWLISNVLSLATQRMGVIGAAIVVMALCAMLILKISIHGSLSLGQQRPWFMRVGLALAIAGVLTQSAQLVSIPTGYAGGSTSTINDPGAINETQLAAFQFIRSHSTPADKVITNKHCSSGTLADQDCNYRWFAVAAWTERRVLVEGWAYTQNGTSPDWVQDELDLGDRFISSPTVTDKRKLQSLGVKYVYVDKRDAYSTNLASVSQQVYTSEWADVYSLK